jgi:acetolactate synthase small subunit
MKSALELRLVNSEGVLERVLGRLRQRGFDLCSMNVERSMDAAFLMIRITVESTRSIDNICRQLEKLIDVQSVKLQYSEENASEGFKYNEKASQREVCVSV